MISFERFMNCVSVEILALLSSFWSQPGVGKGSISLNFIFDHGLMVKLNGIALLGIL